MSQPICPDCGLLAMETSSKCSICGWQGEPRPRKIMYPEDYKRRSKGTAEALKLRKEGKLHFIRVYFEGVLADDWTISGLLQEFITENNFDWKITKQIRDENIYRVEGKKPDAEIITKLSNIDGVKNVVVY